MRSRVSKRRSSKRTRRPRKTTRRSYRKKTRSMARSRTGSRKAILNLTSRKKRNTMLGFSNTSGTGLSTPVTIKPLVVSGVSGHISLWCATAQTLVTAAATNSVVDQAARTATTCYMRGLTESMRITTNSGRPWFWRRICFLTKARVAEPSPSPINSETPYIDTSQGISRQWLNLSINNSDPLILGIQDKIFRGRQGTDWDDLLVAPTDPTRITVKYDKLRTFRSGNEEGTVASAKLWHPMNHNLVYGDDENADGEDTSPYSTTAKPGMGDYYVVDIIVAGTGATTSDLLQLRSVSTLYWHER
uniref:Capsid protein n=1 Tax=Emberiza spodocephala Genomoviridae sp. TaxID=2814950 RepID=A0A8A4XDC8_9VIRU|nr:MAG: capsid protein [Gemycircularvirus]